MGLDRNRGMTRRGLMQSGVALGGAAAGATLGPTEASAAEPAGKALKRGAVVLFQGDSITDAGRKRDATEPNQLQSFGGGYAMFIAAHLLTKYPDLELKCHNRGISGNKVPDLDKRWAQDAVALKPDVLSILIGVNDIWHKLNGNSDGTVESYETGFKALLERTKREIPSARIVVCEPFVLRCGAVNDKWFPEFDERRAAAKRVATGAGADFVPFQTMFDAAVKHAKPEHWAGDGVHPSPAGHALMASTWLSVVGL